MKILRCCGPAVLVIGAALTLVAPQEAKADTYSLTQDSCSGGCGTPPFGTITVTGQGSGTLTIDVEMASGNLIHEQNGSKASPGVYFDLSTTSGGVTFGGLSNNNNTTSTGWTWSSGGPSSFSLDNLGTGNFAAQCLSSATSNTCGSSLVFTVSGNGIALQSLSGGSHGTLWFGVDDCEVASGGGCSNTGPVGATSVPVPAPLVGAGLPGLIVACAGLLGLARRRRMRMA